MKYSKSWFSFFAISACLVLASQAQQVIYLDQNYKPANSSSYTYKRVITLKNEELRATSRALNKNAYGGFGGNAPLTSHAVRHTGLWNCALTDYYKTGQPALIVNVLSLDSSCARWDFNGQAIYYYPGGHVREKAFYNAGKLQGEVVAYNENGTVRDTDYYENGKLIDKKKFAVSPQHPLIGEWKHIDGQKVSQWGHVVADFTKEARWTFNANGILEGRFADNSLPTFAPSIVKTNWKYIPANSGSGVLEEYQGDELGWRGTIRWINRNQFEYTFTFAPDRKMVGRHWTFTRQ